MPRTSRSRQSVIHNEDSSSTSEDESYTPSQNRNRDQLRVHSSQLSQSVALEVPRNQVETMVSDVVLYLLIADMKRTIIKRPEIIKHALKDNARVFVSVIGLAKKKLTDIFGLELKELPNKKGHFIIVNQLEIDHENPHIVWSDQSYIHNALLTLILTMIFMKGNVLAESELWPALAKLGIDTETRHDDFGDVHKLITKEFTKQQYLEYNRIPNSDPAIFEFVWGPRAYLETTKKNMLDLVCTISETLKCDDFAEQFAEASQVE